MNGAIAESTFNVFFKLNYQKTYDAVLATPLGPGDVALGEIGWSVIRATLYAIGFMVVILVLGLVASPWAIFAVPAATLLAFAFGAVGMAATTFMRSWQDFDLIQLVVLPLFLFSGTFYPITSYPPLLQLVVQVTPLYQGVDLIRSLILGAIGPQILVHVVYLTVMGLLGPVGRLEAPRPAAAQVVAGGVVSAAAPRPPARQRRHPPARRDATRSAPLAAHRAPPARRQRHGATRSAAPRRHPLGRAQAPPAGCATAPPRPRCRSRLADCVAPRFLRHLVKARLLVTARGMPPCRAAPYPRHRRRLATTCHEREPSSGPVGPDRLRDGRTRCLALVL